MNTTMELMQLQQTEETKHSPKADAVLGRKQSDGKKSGKDSDPGSRNLFDLETLTCFQPADHGIRNCSMTCKKFLDSTTMKNECGL